jgi:hypothetical protein
VRGVFSVVLALLVVPAVLAAADPAELAGRWVGAIDTPKGQMDIGLTLTLEDGKLAGTLQTHGDWKVTGVTERDGVWTVSFESPGGPGRLSGRLREGRLTGDWESPMAKGVFELTRAKKQAWAAGNRGGPAREEAREPRGQSWRSAAVG